MLGYLSVRADCGSQTGCCLHYIRLLVVCRAFGVLNDLLEQVAFRVYMQLLRVCYSVFFVGYSLGLCLGDTLHAYFAPRRSVWFLTIVLPADITSEA